jgi:polar amino acid transport system substrate-binding protein
MDKKITIGIVITVLVVVGVFAFLYSRSESEVITGGPVDEDEEVRKFLAVTEHFPPFAFEEDGVVKGIDIDIFDLAMERVGVPYEVEIMPWARALKMVEEGDAESILIASYTEERDDWAYFTENQKISKNEVIPDAYLGAHDMVFFIRKIHEDSIKFESFDQIREMDYRVGLDAGYAYGDAVAKAGWNTKDYNNVNENFLALAAGNVDMYLADKAVGLWVVEEMGLQDEITYIEKPVFTFVYHAPFSKNSDYPELEEIWNQTMSELKGIHESGEAEEIYDKYVRTENE